MPRFLAGERFGAWFNRFLGAKPPAKDPNTTAAETILDDIQRIEASLAITPLHRPHRAHLLMQLSSCLAKRYHQDGDLEHLEKAIEHLHLAQDMKVLDSSTRAHICADLGSCLLQRFRHFGETTDLLKVIDFITFSLSEVSEDLAMRVELLNRLSTALRLRYDAVEELDDLNGAIRHLQEAVETVTAQMNVPNHQIMLRNLSSLFHIRYERLGDLADLDSAIKFMEATISATPVDDPLTRGHLLYYLSTSVLQRYEKLHNLHDLEAVMEQTLAALQVLPAGHTLVVMLFENMSNAHEARYNLQEDPNDIDTAILYMKKAIEKTEAKDVYQRAVRLTNLSNMFLSRHEERPSDSDLNEAIECASKAVHYVRRSDDTAPLSNMLTNLGICYNTRFRYTGFQDAGDLERATDAARSAIEVLGVTNLDHPDRPGLLCNLAAGLSNRYLLSNDLNDLEVAIGNLNEAIARMHEADPDRANMLINMASLLDLRYKRLRAVSDLNDGIKYAEKALEVICNQKRETGRALRTQVEYTRTLCHLLNIRSQRLNCPQDLDSAILHAGSMLGVLPDSHPDRSKVLKDLSVYLIIRYNRQQALSDLDEATVHMKSCIEETAKDDPDRVSRLNQLAVILISRYSRLREPADLKEGIEHVEEVLEMTPENDPKRAESLTYLSNLLRWQHRRLDAAGSLQAAVACAEAAVRATPALHPDYKCRLGDLSAALHARYDRFGNIEDLELAIRHTETCLKDTAVGSPGRTRSLIDLGGMLRCKYRRFGALSDLEAGFEYIKAAVAETPLDHPDRERIVNTLGPFLGSRYARLGASADLEAAIQRSKAALEATKPDDPSFADRLESVGGYLTTLYMAYRTPCDLDEAIQHIEKALEITPEDDPERPGRLSSLGKCYHVRFEHSAFNDRNMNDLDAAIEYENQAVLATPLDVPSRAHRLTCLGTNLRLRHKLKLQKGLYADDDRTRAFNAFIDAWKCQTAPPNTRVQAVWRAVKFFQSYELISPLESSILLEEAVELLPKISLRSLEQDDQQQLLSSLYGLSSLAASSALEAGRGAYIALKLLELGRGIITGFAIDNRSEMSDLQTSHPTLFDSLINLRTEANSPLPEKGTGNPTDYLNSSASKRRIALEQMDALLERIREIPEYKGFLLPPSPESLMKMAEHGSIAIMCATPLRSDAIIITKSAIESIELKKLLYKDAKTKMRDMAMNLVRGGFGTWGKRNKEMVKLLAWLWETAVKPVLDKVNPESKNSRIWWIGIGELSRAPFHAAGYHKKGCSKYAMNKVISSYIPTVKSLLYARQRDLRLNMTSTLDSQLLLVTMPSTPGHPDLPSVQGEVAALVEIVENKEPFDKIVPWKTKILQEPCAKGVMEQLPEFDAVHFACHGVSDSNNPSNSSLLLLNKAVEGDSIDRLTVRDISRATSSKAQLAYLSACSTADNAAIELGDETIHLAGAFQLAGFNHVVATMWQSRDTACKTVAEGFYTRLYRGDGGGGGGNSGAGGNSGDTHLAVSMALHEAVKKARAECRDRPLTWAPFIHTGA
ncbi:uncharacterized protein H6S33_007906 [Morchella sextelata]|uniref:uncharacterized protein n=1 Tax=Morchella sextelata TaxID=1174677 RepID=UPI001D043B92|nr:uncharacterized protein H6S33_007906 [Morchella sextelata]KAH0603584.1 hypothetical protein H6S33_007906 [Morchella sextelata]